MNWVEIIKSIAPNLNGIGTFMPSKYTFKYDWFKNPTIFDMYAGSGSNDSFAFSKGDVVYATSAGVSYATDAPVYNNTVWVENVKFNANKPESIDNPKTINVPIEYLTLVDNSTPVTLQTGVNFGQNPIPVKQGGSVILPNPVMPLLVKPIPFNPVTETILEENASFYLSKDFQYVSGGRSGSDSCPMCKNYTPIYSTLKAGTKVTGRLFKQSQTYKTSVDIVASQQFLAVKGYGSQGSINIPIEYLTKELPTNRGIVVPAENNNKNMLMIVGAFLVGYVLFNKGKGE